MIEKLTKAQKDRFPFYVDKWTKIGLSTKPLNEKEIIKSLHLLFSTVGKESARPIICTSPLALWLTIGVLRSASVRWHTANQAIRM